MKDTYTIMVRGKRYTVPKAVYDAYYQHRERERYLHGLALAHERSLERFAQDGVSVEYQYAMSRPSLEDSVLHNQQLGRLRECLSQLCEADRILITALFYQGRSERSLAAELCIPQKTLHDRKQRVLCKLLKMMVSEK